MFCELRTFGLLADRAQVWHADSYGGPSLTFFIPLVNVAADRSVSAGMLVRPIFPIFFPRTFQRRSFPGGPARGPEPLQSKRSARGRTLGVKVLAG